MRWILALLWCTAARAQNPELVVYGGTAGGVMTAVAARGRVKIALLEPGDHVGGMVTGGLSGTDVGNREVIGGKALEFLGVPDWRTTCRDTCSTLAGCRSRAWRNRSCCKCWATPA